MCGCAAVPVRALLQLPLLGVNRGYKGLYGGGWPLRGMGAAGTALGAADARTNEHYEIGTILTQKSQGDFAKFKLDVMALGAFPASATSLRPAWRESTAGCLDPELWLVHLKGCFPQD